VRLLTLLPPLVIGLIFAAVTGMWQFAIFALVSALSVWVGGLVAKRGKSKTDDDLSDEPISVRDGRVFIGDLRLPKSALFWRAEWHDVLFDHFAGEAAKRESRHRAEARALAGFKADKPGRLPFWVGLSNGADLEFDLASHGPHAIIVGATGAGKSELLKLVCSSMLSSVADRSIALVLADFKGGASLRAFSNEAATLILHTDLEESVHERFWLLVHAELRQREKFLAEHKVSTIDEIAGLPRWVLVADELAAMISSHPFAVSALEALTARGRSLGMHLIATTQSLSGIPRALLANLNLRFVLGGKDNPEYLMLLPNLKGAIGAEGRALAIDSNQTVSSFDFEVGASRKVDLQPSWWPDQKLIWSGGLPSRFIADNSNEWAIADYPLEQRTATISLDALGGKPLLVIGAHASGKTSFISALGSSPQLVCLDEPNVPDLEATISAAQTGGSDKLLIVALSSNATVPMQILRKFENVVHLRQANLEQHLAAGLPKLAYNPKLSPGRGWFRGDSVQLVG
jgi:hypothetical protein